MRFTFKDFILIIGIIITFFLVLSLIGFYFGVRPLRILSNETPANYGLKFENVAFKTQDNILIRGWYIPNPDPKAKTIILLHGYPADKGNILPSRIFLHKKFNLLFIDFRYFGESEGFYSTVGKKEVYDLLAALQFLHEKGINEVGVWGFSLGGAVAILAAEEASEIKAIVAESSFAELNKMATAYFRIPILKYPLAALLRLWGWLFLGYDVKQVSPVNSATKLKIPILFIHSRQDEVISFEHAEIFQKALDKKKNVQFLILDNARHGEEPGKLQKIVEEFFEKNL